MELPTIITTYLDTLTDVEQDRVLEGKMGEAGDYLRADGCRCLVGTVRDYRTHSEMLAERELLDDTGWWFVGVAFDRLCLTAGGAETGAAIRDYIWELRARRALAGVRDVVTV